MTVNLNAGQTEATVGMAALRTIFPSPVFGLPVTLCRLCPQYGHKIIFSKKCYNERKCPLPAVLVFIHRKTRAGKAELYSEREDGAECYQTLSQMASEGQFKKPLAEGSREPSGADRCPDSKGAAVGNNSPAPDSHFESIHHGERTVNTLNKPKISHVLASHFLRRLSSTISKRIAYNDPTRENTNFGWRKKQ